MTGCPCRSGGEIMATSPVPLTRLGGSRGSQTPPSPSQSSPRCPPSCAPSWGSPHPRGCRWTRWCRCSSGGSSGSSGGSGNPAWPSASTASSAGSSSSSAAGQSQSPFVPSPPAAPRAPVAHRCPRSALMTLIALRNLALGRPAPERLAQEVTYANWRGEEEAWPETNTGAQRGPEL